MPQPPRPVSDQWKQIVHDAHDAGKLVYSMDQTNLIRLSGVDDADLTEEGVCFAACVHWMGLRARSRDFDRLYRSQTRGFHHLTGIPDQIYSEQVNRTLDVGLSPVSTKGLTQSVMLARQGLRATRKALWAGVPGISQAHVNLPAFIGGTGALFLVSLYRQGGAHAICLQSDGAGDTYRLFDPNFGHFKVTGLNSFGQFLQDFFATSGYGQRYTRAVQVYQIEGPGPSDAVQAPAVGDHALIDRSLHSVPASPPAAVIEWATETQSRIHFRKAVNQRQWIARTRFLRVFVVGPADDDRWRRAVRTVLSDGDMFTGKGCKLKVTPLVRQEFAKVEIRIHLP